MNTIFKRSLTALLALIMALGVVIGTVSCADTNDDPKDTTASTAGDDTSAGDAVESETTPSAYESLEKEKFTGKTFVICAREDFSDDVVVEELSNDTLNDLIYEQNMKIESDFGITFDCVKVGSYTDVNTTLSTQATSNTDDYDMYMGHKFSFSACAQNGYCYNLNNVSTLDLDGEWWDQACNNNLTIDGKTFCLTGDIFPSSMRASSCIVFNKVLMENLQMSVTELNTLAQNGEWTLDQLLTYTAEVSRDLNGDDTMTYDKDRYGITSWMMDIPFSLYYGAGKPFVSIVDGSPELTYEGSNEQVLNIYEKMYKLIVTQKAYFVTDEAQYETCYDVFADGRGLFCDITLGKINSMIVARNMKDEYGILPVPKYDTNQEEYLSFVNGAIPFVMVSNGEKDLEFVGAILEAMARYNYDNVTPKMFEIVTKLQAAQDPVSSSMVDLIVRNRVFDLAYFFNWDISNVIWNGLKSGTETLSSSFRTATNKARSRELKLLVEAYDKVE